MYNLTTLPGTLTRKKGIRKLDNVQIFLDIYFELELSGRCNNILGILGLCFPLFYYSVYPTRLILTSKSLLLSSFCTSSSYLEICKKGSII